MEENYYSEYAEIQHTHWWYLARATILETILRNYLTPDRSRKVLDLGCGPGQMRPMLSQFGQLVSTDFSFDALRYCSSQRLDYLVNADGTDLPFASNSLDVICAFDFLEHVRDDIQCVSELNRVLKPDGYLFLTVPAFQWLWGRQDIISQHFRRYNSRQVEGVLIVGNFSVRKLSYFNTILFPFIALIRLAYRLLGFVSNNKKAPVSSDFSIPNPGPLNELFKRMFLWEKRFLLRRNFPFGVSILCVAQKRSHTS